MEILPVVHVVAAVLQVLAAVLALHFVRLAGRSSAWILLALAFLLMGVLSMLEFAVEHGQLSMVAYHAVLDWSGLAVSLLILAGVYRMRAVFIARNLAEERFRTIGAVAPDAIIMVDGSGTIAFWNPAAERLFGYAAEEALGQPLHKLVVPERLRAQAEQGFRQFQQTGAGPLIGRTAELSGLKRNGEEFASEHAVSAFQIEGRWHALGIVRDITERKAAQARLEQQLDELRRFEKVAVGRELRIQELAQENRSLKDKLAGLGRS